MTRTTRKRIFYVLVLLFFVISGAVILYAEGWRLDPKTLQTEKVGAVFVRAFPENAQIFVDGKPTQNKSGFLSAGTLVSDLFPGNYSVTLKEPGYLDWNESLAVEPTLVTELNYAVLVPQKAVSAATSSVQSFFVAGGTVIDENTSGTIEWRAGTIGRGTIVGHSTDLKEVIIQNPSGEYTIDDLAAQTSTIISAIQNIAIDPYDPTTAFAWNSQNIWSIDISRRIITQIATPPAGYTFGPSLAIGQSYVAWSRALPDASSSLVVGYDKFVKIPAATTTITGTITELKWIDANDLGIIANNGSLYYYNIPSRTLTTLAQDVKDFFPAPDGSMVAALEHNSVEIFPITDGEYYRFNLPNVDSAKSLIWYKDDGHLFVEYPDHVSFLDFVDTGLHNFITVSEGTSPSYDPSTNSLYIIDQGQKLIRFDFPN